MIDKTMNWTAPLGRAQPGLGRIPHYGDYMSGQSATNGGAGVTGEGLRYTNGTLRMRFHYPPLEQSKFYVTIPELRMHQSCCAFLAVE
jgi:hypothetical protein